MAESLSQDLGHGAENIDEWPPTSTHQIWHAPAYTENNMTNTDSYICHICNMDVPKSFIKEHESSTIHKTNLAISIEAAERLGKHQNQEINLTSNGKTDESTYFCDTCVEVVEFCDLTLHGESETHERSSRGQKLLKDFSNIYLYDMDDIDIKRYSKMEKSEDCRLKASTEHTVDSNTYIKFLSCLYDSHPSIIVNVVNNDRIEITASNGYRLEVSTLNFHSYAHVGPNEVICKVCSPCHGLTLTGLDIEAHKFTMGHMKRIMSLIEDMQGLRQLSEKILHCVHCNQILENSPSRIRTHILCNGEHIHRLEQSVHRPARPLVTGRTTRYLHKTPAFVEPAKNKRGKTRSRYVPETVRCHVCGLSMGKPSLEDHLRGRKHQRKWLASQPEKQK